MWPQRVNPSQARVASWLECHLMHVKFAGPIPDQGALGRPRINVLQKTQKKQAML